jgi:hypothetical protein
MLTVEGGDWANDWSVFSQRFDDNLVYQFHYYCWDRPTALKSIGQYLANRRRLGAPIWCGETGEKDNAIYWGTTEYFEANGVGWSFWPWKKMETSNTPYSIKTPAGWETVRGYSRGESKPAADVAQKAFDELLRNIRLENCVFYPDVVNALFRRAPGKVEAENFGHEGSGKSFSVKNNSEHSKLYRTSEPVLVEAVQGGGGWRGSGGQAIKLNAGEWTAYTVGSQESCSYEAAVRVKAESGPVVMRISVGANEQEVTIKDEAWTEAPLKPVAFVKGVNRLKVSVEKGSVLVDWVKFQ